MEVHQKLDSNNIVNRIRDNFPEMVLSSAMPYGLLTLEVKAEKAYDIIRFLKQDETLNFTFLTTLCGIHYPDEDLPLGVIYHMHNLERRTRIRLKTFLPADKPEIRSVTDLFSAANWMERETFDFFGIVFTGHPGLKRILNVDYLDYFPMRKEYPLEEQSRTDKDDTFFGR